MRYVCWPNPALRPVPDDFMKPERLSLQQLPPAPSIPAKAHSFEVHGVRIHDDYSWLKAENWKEVLQHPEALDPSIRACLEQENAYAAAALAGTEEFQARLVAEMRGRII
jgi:oligopeptidase B